MAITWPSGIPDDLLLREASETFASNTIRTQMEVGPAKVRRRATSAPRSIGGKLLMTKTQAATLDTFYTTTTGGGASAFTWHHPRTRADVSMRFTAPPVLTSAGAMWMVQLALEILP